MTEVDQAYERTRSGDPEGFADWVRRVELPLRSSLRSFARWVDVEAIVQEGLMRMWILAPQLALSGENASYRYSARLMRNLALQEVRRARRFHPLGDAGGSSAGPPPEDQLPALEPTPDPLLRRAILECLSRLRDRPRQALLARLASLQAEADSLLADRLGLKLNTFLQHIVRARKALTACLEGKGMHVPGVGK